MAQVIRKYLEGGKTKPTIVKIDGRDYNYDDIERNVWGNFEAHAKANNWDAETLNAVRDYLEYSLAGLKSGELNYGHNRMNNVSLEYETDGTFNTKGKGLFKRDITNDKRAGATLGTAYYNTLFNNSVMNEYKAPELKNIGSSLTLDVAKKIMDNNYGGNAEAMQEGWYKLTPLDRYIIFKQALADLNYSADEYKDVERFNTKRANLLQLLENPYTDELNPEIEKAYAALGGYGLANLLKGEAKKEDGTEELKPKTIEEWRKDWRNEAIQNGIETEQGIADYIALKERAYNETQSQPGLLLKSLQEYDKFESASKSLDNYIKFSKENTYRKYRFNREAVNIGIEKMDKGDYYKFDNFSKSSIKNTTKNLTKQLREGKVNPFMWRGLIHYWVSNGLTPYQSEDGQRLVYVIPNSMDLDSETVAVVANGNIMLASIHDFPMFAKQFNSKFRTLYKGKYNIDLPDNWWETYLKGKPGVTLTQEELQVQSNKNGGILKAQDGAAFFRAMATQTGDYDQQAWNTVTKNLQARRLAEIDEATDLGITVEELRKRKAEQADLQKARDEKIFSPNGKLSGSDIARMAALTQDVGALVTSFVPVYGTAISGGLGLTSALTDLGADWTDKSVSTGLTLVNLGMNLGLAGLGMIPGGKSGSIGVKLLKYTPKIITALAALNVAPKTIDAFKKGSEKGFRNLTREEWKDIYYGLKIVTLGGAGARRGYVNRLVMKNNTASVGENTYEITTKSGTKKISKSEVDAIKGKASEEATKYLREQKILGENEELSPSTLNKLTKGKLGKDFTIKETKNSSKRLMTFDEVVELNNGVLPRHYVTYVMAHPSVVSKKDYIRVLNTVKRDPSFAKRLALITNPYEAGKYYFGNLGTKGGYKVEGYEKKTTTENKPQTVSEKALAVVPGERVRTWYQAGREAARYPTEEVGITKSLVPINPVKDVVRFDDGTLRMVRYNLDLKALHDTVFKNKLHLFVVNSKPILLLAQRNITNGYRVTKPKKGTIQKYKKEVQEALKSGKPLIVTRDGVVTFGEKNTTAYRLNPNEKVTVKIRGIEKEVPVAEAMANGYQVVYNKQGGFIYRVLSKFQQGGTIVGNVSSDGKNWNDVIFSQFFNDLYEGLKSGKFTLDDINEMLKRHQQLWAHYDANKGAYVGYDNNVGNYLLDIINKYGFVNDKGINNGWTSNRYTTILNRRYNTDHKNADGSYAADNVYGGQTDDRRILGREGDFTSEQLANYNNKLKDLGIEMYLAGEPGSNKPYYMLRKLGTSENSNNNLSTPNRTYTDPITGESLLYDPNTGQFKAIGNGNPQTKPKVQKIGEDVLNYIKNINPADAIALGRALWGENVNNKVAELTKLMQTALLDPQYQTAILHGNYNAKMLAQELAGKINAAALKPISSDAGTNFAARLEAALKATLALQQGNAEDSEMYWKTLLLLSQANNENAAQEVATGNENRSRVTAAYNNRLQAEAARLAANFEQIWQPFFAGVEKRYSDEDILRRQAEIDNWKYKITSEYEKKNDLIMENYKARLSQEAKNWNENNPKYKEYNGDFWNYFAREVSPEYLKLIKNVSREMYDVLYGGLSRYYGLTPFQLKRTPEIEVPGINGDIYRNYAVTRKSGGTLSAAERQALKTTNEINKNIRQAARETYKNIREDKREHRKAMALVSQLSADLIKKAVGIK